MASWVKSSKFRNFTDFNRAKFLVSVTFEKQNKFFYNLRTTWGIEMKPWPREQNFLWKISRSMQNPLYILGMPKHGPIITNFTF